MLMWPSVYLSNSNMPSYQVISLRTRFVATKIRSSDRVFMAGFGVVYVYVSLTLPSNFLVILVD